MQIFFPVLSYRWDCSGFAGTKTHWGQFLSLYGNVRSLDPFIWGFKWRSLPLILSLQPFGGAVVPTAFWDRHHLRLQVTGAFLLIVIIGGGKHFKTRTSWTRERYSHTRERRSPDYHWNAFHVTPPLKEVISDPESSSSSQTLSDLCVIWGCCYCVFNTRVVYFNSDTKSMVVSYKYHSTLKMMSNRAGFRSAHFHVLDSTELNLRGHVCKH